MQIDSARKSRPIYEKIKKQKIVRPYQEEIWETVFNQHDIDFQKVYLCKIKYIPDRKLSEFNFKVFTSNLALWSKSEAMGTEK